MSQWQIWSYHFPDDSGVMAIAGEGRFYYATCDLRLSNQISSEVDDGRHPDKVLSTYLDQSDGYQDTGEYTRFTRGSIQRVEVNLENNHINIRYANSKGKQLTTEVPVPVQSKSIALAEMIAEAMGLGMKPRKEKAKASDALFTSVVMGTMVLLMSICLFVASVSPSESPDANRGLRISKNRGMATLAVALGPSGTLAIVALVAIGFGGYITYRALHLPILKVYLPDQKPKSIKGPPRR